MVNPLLSSSHEAHWSLSTETREWFQLIWTAVTIFLINNVFMSVVFVRRRWRAIWLGTFLLGLCSMVIVQAYPCAVCYPFAALPTVFGFADPRVDWQSFRRNGKPLWLKSMSAIGALLHHTGTVLLVGVLFGVIVDDLPYSQTLIRRT